LTHRPGARRPHWLGDKRWSSEHDPQRTPAMPRRPAAHDVGKRRPKGPLGAGRPSVHGVAQRPAARPALRPSINPVALGRRSNRALRPAPYPAAVARRHWPHPRPRPPADLSPGRRLAAYPLKLGSSSPWHAWHRTRGLTCIPWVHMCAPAHVRFVHITRLRPFLAPMRIPEHFLLTSSNSVDNCNPAR